MYIHLPSTSMQTLVYIDIYVLSTYVYTCMCTYADINMNYSTLGGNAAGKDACSSFSYSGNLFPALGKHCCNIRYYIVNGKD